MPLQQLIQKNVATRAAARPVVNRPSVIGSVSSKFAAIITAGALVLSPIQAEAAPITTMADVTRQTFSFADTNGDGIVTKDELVQLSRDVAKEEKINQPSDEQLDFTLRLFDLNQDGRLSTDEMLTALALDAGVTEDTVDNDLWAAFDRNGDNYVDASEFRAGLPDIGADSDGVKDYIFRRVEQLGDRDNKLDLAEFGNAFTLFRSVVLGY